MMRTDIMRSPRFSIAPEVYEGRCGFPARSRIDGHGASGVGGALAHAEQSQAGGTLHGGGKAAAVVLHRCQQAFVELSYGDSNFARAGMFFTIVQGFLDHAVHAGLDRKSVV